MGAAASAMIPKQFPAASAADPRLLVIMLRGALDGFAAVAPLSDPEYPTLRCSLHLKAATRCRSTASFPSTPTCPSSMRSTQQARRSIIHAVATAYRERSHFDGQDALETGLPRPSQSSGWLNRLAARPSGGRAREAGAVARPHRSLGHARTSAYPVLVAAALCGSDDDTVLRLITLYEARDPLLAAAPRQAWPSMQRPGRRSIRTSAARAASSWSKRAGRRFSQTPKARASPHELGRLGHACGGGPAKGGLAGLSARSTAWRAGLGPVWATPSSQSSPSSAAPPHQRHGGHRPRHGGVAFLVGGAVKGGRVLADWPGLDDKPFTRAAT